MSTEAAAGWPAGIRPADRRDLAAIEAIEAAAFEPSRRSSRRTLQRALCSDFQRVLVLEVDDAVAGYLVFWPYRHTWRIYNLATAPASRNRGVAGRLIGAVVEAARRAGARQVVLESRDEPDLVQVVLESRDEPDLVGYYEARGFRARRSLPDYYSSGEHAIRMVLEVS
jgi:ribosomal protein S18 acetylase RimI-like enzyme